jgi:polyhydroxybutyrate depolymerase
MERLIAGLLALCLLLPASARAATDLKFEINKVQRMAHMETPKSFAERKGKFPVLIVLHEAGEGGMRMNALTGFEALGEKENFISVFPDGIATATKRRMTWNAVTCCGRAQSRETDDVLFLDNVIDRIIDDYRGDPDRIYMVGQGNGGMMTYRYACKHPERLAAIAVSGGQAAYRDCKKTSRAVPILQISGTKDICMPYEGGERCGACFSEIVAVNVEPFSCLSARGNMDIWARQGGCDANPQPGPGQGDVSCQSWKNCRGGSAINFCTITGGGHSWPGVDNMPPNCQPKHTSNQCKTWRRIFGALTTDIVATDFVWGYLKGHKIP